MSSWTNPKIDWDTGDYYNYGDLDRVESNTEYIYDELIALGYSPTLASIVTGRDNTSLVFYDDLNRIEGNIKALKDASFTPLTWTSPVIDWATLDIFDYADANRLEQNLYYLKEIIDKIKASFRRCGTFNSGSKMTAL